MSKDDKNLKFFQNQNSMNGLVNFIAEMRTCRVRELEQKRVNKELANIRAKFKDERLSGYHRKKYIAKLLYMYILGYEIDFGHMEAVNLMASQKYSEKHMVFGGFIQGYLAVTLMIGEDGGEYQRFVVQNIKRDLEDPNEIYNCLALHAVANIGGKELSMQVSEEIHAQFVSRSRSTFVKKKAGLCLLRLYRKYPEIIPGRDWAQDIVSILDDENLGVVNAAACLVTALVQAYPESYSGAVTKAIMKMNAIVVNGEFDPCYLYYKIPAPWLQVKLLRLLQYYPAPQSPEVVNVLDKVIRTLLSNGDTPHKNYNQGNAVNAVLFETINYIIHLDPNSDLIKEASKILGSFLVGRETNFRYLALETMAHIAATGDPLGTLQAHQDVVIQSLTDKDISIRRRALDLLYSMCNQSNCRHIVGELLTYLTNNSDYEFQEELVLKIAILAEKFVSEYTWYVDVILKLITTAGDAASDSLWHRVVQIVTNHSDLREYAAYTILQACKEQTCHEVTVRIAGHILGEFGDVIVDSPGCSPLEQFMALHSKFGLFSSTTRAILLSTYLKFVNLFPEIKSEVIKVFEAYQYVLDVELQQRACEYLAILKLPNDTTLQTVCEEMPPFAEKESTLLSQLTSKIHDTQDARTWVIGGQDAQKDIQKVVAMKKAESRDVHEVDRPTTPVAPIKSASPQRQESPVLQGPSPELINKQFISLLTNPNGVLYEDNTIQIGIKSEYQNNFGRLAIFFGNKTTIPLQDFKARVTGDQDLKITVLEACPATVPASTQLHQMYSIEAVAIPTAVPPLEVIFTFSGQPKQISLKIPIILTKFMSPCVMSSADYLGRYKQIGGGEKENQITITPPSGLNLEYVRKTVEGLGFAILDGVDPNPANLVFASIFVATTIGKVGCLGRIETNSEHGMYRLTIRATNEGVSAGTAANIMALLNI